MQARFPHLVGGVAHGLVLLLLGLQVTVLACAVRAEQPVWTPNTLECGECDDSECCPCAAPSCGWGLGDTAPMGGWLGFYFGAGPTIPLGNDPFTSHRDAGVSIQGGARQALTYDPHEFLFFDLGGSFLSVRGQRSGVIPAALKNTVTNTSTPIQNAYDTTLLNIRRASVDAALGGYFNPLGYFGIRPDVIRAMVRGGGRIGSAYGRFHETPTTDLINAVNLARALGESVSVGQIINKTDTFEGLFIGGGLDFIVTEPNPRFGNRPFLTLGANAEYSHDWINFRHFSKQPLDVIAIMAHGTLIF